MERKTFIKTCGLTCLGGSLVSTLLQGCASANYYAQNTITESRITVKKTEFVTLEKEKTVQRKYVLVRTEKTAHPICLYKTSDDQYTALLMECTHKGCELQPHGEYLTCPCHGSEFSNKGVVQNPPAEENLKSFQTITDNENIYIQL